MRCIPRVSLQCFLLLLSLSFLSLYLLMDILRVGSLNINGGRDRNKRAIITEYAYLKDFNVMFLQETHSNAILFSKHLDLNILSTIELEKGRILMAIVEIKELKFLFLSMYMLQI